MAWKKCCHPSHWVHLSHPYQLHTTSSRKLYNPPVLEKIKCFIRDLSIYIQTTFILLKQKWNIGVKLLISIFCHKLFIVWCLKSSSFISAGKEYAKVSVYWLLEYVRHPCGMLCECSVICDLYILIIWNLMGYVFQKFVPCVDFVENRQCPDLFFWFEAQSFDWNFVLEYIFQWQVLNFSRFATLVQNKRILVPDSTFVTVMLLNLILEDFDSFVKTYSQQDAVSGCSVKCCV